MDIIKTLEDINNKLIHAKTDIQRHKLQYTYDNLVDRYIFHIVAALLICPNPALNYCRKLLMSFAV